MVHEQLFTAEKVLHLFNMGLMAVVILGASQFSLRLRRARGRRLMRNGFSGFSTVRSHPNCTTYGHSLSQQTTPPSPPAPRPTVLSSVGVARRARTCHVRSAEDDPSRRPPQDGHTHPPPNDQFRRFQRFQHCRAAPMPELPVSPTRTPAEPMRQRSVVTMSATNS